ncbi:uncharacterized protein LOC122267343 [Penaeus japonicus]|uniref:uncharacterized protein LOC122267343 n=1 Tax=Penaeus japonicus TaxID=27405 RepID=UPI001C71240A|nr:uncharacterized protein LOC122267343 [Penaeus japonicus]
MILYQRFLEGSKAFATKEIQRSVARNIAHPEESSAISAIAKNAYRQFCHERGSNSETNDHQLNLLKKLREDNDLIITKPDKGRGIVLLNRTEYDSKVKAILDDRTKFKLLKTNIASHILKLEDKLNRFLRNIKDSVGDSVYNCLFASGSRPGVLYGLPKIHKTGNPIRPIISSIGTFNYNLAKFLVPLLTPLTKNDYTVENTTDFVKEITTVKIKGPVVMASVDVQSLFTNVPLEETTNLIVRKLVK